MPRWSVVRRRSVEQRNLAARAGAEPGGTAGSPRETTGEVADAVQVAFQIRERKFARGFVDCFFPREAGCAEREHVSFDRLAIAQLVCFADFEKAQTALAVVQIPFERADHADDAVRAHHGCVFRQRIADHRGRDALRREIARRASGSTSGISTIS